MDYEKLQYQLRLISLLAQGKYYSASELCAATGLQERTVYRNLKYFPKIGLTLEKKGSTYRLCDDAPFVKELTSSLRFTLEESDLLLEVLDRQWNTSLALRCLREKIRERCDRGIVIPPSVSSHEASSIRTIAEAIRTKQQVVLRNYASPHSQQLSDRIVEPYVFLEGNREVRCYESASRMHKTFHLQRAEAVELLGTPWKHEAKHRPVYADFFHFSGEERFSLRLRLGILAKNVLIEEYPQAVNFLVEETRSAASPSTYAADSEKASLTLAAQAEATASIHPSLLPTHSAPLQAPSWLLVADFCSFKGIGRFVIGLINDIEILPSPAAEDFRLYLGRLLQQAQQKLSIPIPNTDALV